MKWAMGLLVIAVLAFAFLWLNAYKERFDVARAYASAAVNELAVARDAVNEDFARTKGMPPPREFPSSSKYVRSIKLDPDGRLVATLSSPDGGAGVGKRVVYESRVSGTGIEWRCHSPDLEKKYLPPTCR